METVYSITHSLRMIFSNKDATKTSGHQCLSEWYKKVDNFWEKNFCAVVSTIKARQGEVLYYFVNRATNTAAESFQSKIKQFRVQLHGVIDVKFFLFRLTNIYA